MSAALRVEDVAAEYETPQPLRRRHVSRQTRHVAGIGIVAAVVPVLFLAGVGAVSLLKGVTSGSDLPLVGETSTAGLHAVLGSAHRAYGYATVTGAVSNTGSSRESNIEAIVELVDSENRTVQLDKAMVECANIPAGESAPFRIMVRDDANAVGYRLWFKHPDGQLIAANR